MSYPKRPTFKFTDCRPEIYRHRDYFQKPARICNDKCPYSILCNMEINHPTIGDRIKNIRLILQRPWVVWGYLEDDRTVIMLLEGPNVQRLMFRGEGSKKGIVDAVEVAEKYIAQERKIGTLRNKNEDEESSEQNGQIKEEAHA